MQQMVVAFLKKATSIGVGVEKFKPSVLLVTVCAMEDSTKPAPKPKTELCYGPAVPLLNIYPDIVKPAFEEMLTFPSSVQPRSQ